MKVSKYNFIIDNDLGGALFNSKTGAIVLFTPEESQEIKQLLSAPTTNSKYKEELIEGGFIVNYDLDETKELIQRQCSYINNNNTLSITLLPAEFCNFNCSYCFVNHKENIYQKKWVYDAVINYIENKTDENNNLKVKIVWFGGEPLLNLEGIAYFAQKLELLCTQKGIQYEQHIATNGYLLSKDSFQQLLALNITNFLITFDGDKGYHDNIRQLKDDSGTFDTIYSNLLDISKTGPKKEFKIALRGNILRDNFESLSGLLNKYIRDFSTDKRFTMQFRPIIDFDNDKSSISQVKDKICNLDEQLLLQNKLLFKMLPLGIESSNRLFSLLPTPTLSWCSSIHKNSLIVGADGEIYLCESHITEKDRAAGNISKDGKVTFTNDSSEWQAPLHEIVGTEYKCFSCKLLPICFGGCRRELLKNRKTECYWSSKQIVDGLKKIQQIILKESKETINAN